MTFFLTLIIFSVIVIVFFIAVYNNIVSNKNRVKRTWANVITQERQKNKIVPHLEEITKKHTEFEKKLQTDIAKFRSKMNDMDASKIDVQGLQQTQNMFTKLLSGFNATIEAYPNLTADKSFTKLMDEITEQQENVGASIRLFNQAVENFNNLIQTFPNLIVNNLFNKEQTIETFKDNEAEAGFDYKPNI